MCCFLETNSNSAVHRAPSQNPLVDYFPISTHPKCFICYWGSDVLTLVSQLTPQETTQHHGHVQHE